MRIGKSEIGKGRAFLIAEIGGNHEGDFEKAEHMVREAAAAGADAVKFQVFEAGKLVNPHSAVAAYSGASHEKQWERFKKMEFSLEQYRRLKELSDKEGVTFMASVFDLDWLRKIDPLLNAFKVASGDMTYRALLGEMKKTGKPLIVSTGAAEPAEIEDLVEFLGRENLALLHCVCAYPAPPDQMNLSTLPDLARRFGIPVGFSDHSLGPDACLVAASLGAAILEKHFTLDPSNPVGDHKHSLTPETLKQLVDSVREIEKSPKALAKFVSASREKELLGHPRRGVFDCEKKARPLVRRSLYSARDLEAGCRLSAGDVIALRPLEGIPAEFELRAVGRRLTASVRRGQPLLESHLAS